jgi:hypothetical protein
MLLINCPACFSTIEILSEARLGQHVTCEICERVWKIMSWNPLELDSIFSWDQRPRSFIYDESDEFSY